MVLEILGHSQIATPSDIYTHVMPAQYGEVANALDAWLEDDGHAADEDDAGEDEALGATLGYTVGYTLVGGRERRRPRS